MKARLSLQNKFGLQLVSTLNYYERCLCEVCRTYHLKDVFTQSF